MMPPPMSAAAPTPAVTIPTVRRGLGRVTTRVRGCTTTGASTRWATGAAICTRSVAPGEMFTSRSITGPLGTCATMWCAPASTNRTVLYAVEGYAWPSTSTVVVVWISEGTSMTRWPMRESSRANSRRASSTALRNTAGASAGSCSWLSRCQVSMACTMRGGVTRSYAMARYLRCTGA